jgi:SAM-dependent methyltransferase
MKAVGLGSKTLQQADIIDRDLVATFRKRAIAKARGGEDFLLVHAMADITWRLSAVGRTFENGLMIAPMAFNHGAEVLHSGKLRKLSYLDTVQHPGENLPFEPGEFDLVLSVLALQDVNDVPGMLVQMRRLLKPDGLMLAVMLGGDTLTELRHALTKAEAEVYRGASPRVTPFADVRTAGALLQRTGFALPVTDGELLTVRYDHLWSLMRDLRGAGGQNALHARSRKPVGRRFFARAAEIYTREFSDEDQRVRATFDFVSLSGWAPHESQQKPLKPGSGKISLATLLQPPEDA